MGYSISIVLLLCLRARRRISRIFSSWLEPRGHKGTRIPRHVIFTQQPITLHREIAQQNYSAYRQPHCCHAKSSKRGRKSTKIINLLEIVNSLISELLVSKEPFIRSVHSVIRRNNSERQVEGTKLAVLSGVAS